MWVTHYIAPGNMQGENSVNKTNIDRIIETFFILLGCDEENTGCLDAQIQNLIADDSTFDMEVSSLPKQNIKEFDYGDDMGGFVIKSVKLELIWGNFKVS